MRVVDEAIEDGIGERGIGNALMPVGDRQLSRHQGSALPIAVVQDLEQISSLDRTERIAQPVIKDQEAHLAEGVERSRV